MNASQPLLSVVIPVYNGTPFLRELIESLHSQELVPDEVVFVDDGSTDGSAEMIQTLGAALPCVKLIRQENQGQAVARNIGLKAATGRYLAFVDADDIVEPQMYATLVDLAEKEQLDISMGNAWNFNEGRKHDTLVYKDVQDTGVITGEEWFQKRWVARYLPHYCWMQVYRREFLDRHRFSFPLADPHEDVIWVTETLLAAKRLHFSPLPLYRYRKKIPRPSAPAPVLASGLRRNKVIESALFNTRRLSEISHSGSLQPLTRRLLRKDFVNGGCNCVRQIRGLSDPSQRAYYLMRLHEEGLMSILWRNASGISQYWRVLRYHWLSYR
jgi:heptose III glucuronosyltransferase